MKHPDAEFSRPLNIDRVPRLGSTEKISADAGELVALAKRLDVPKLHALSAKLRVTPWRGGGLKLEGELTADLEQMSVVSLEAFRATVTFPVERYFLPDRKLAGAEEEEADPIIEGHIDLGEVVAETLALELNPYPRKPGEDFADPAPEEIAVKPPVSPFAALKGLKKDGDF